MAIQKQFLLRYRNNGHVRFQIPAGLCEKEIAKLLSSHIAVIDGVTSVNLYKSQGKLSIRYQESVCDFAALAAKLFALLADLERQGCFQTKTALVVSESKVLRVVKHNRLTQWFGEKFQAAKETAQAAKILSKAAGKGSNAWFKDPEKAVIDFFNDILVLYLIKLHWTRITQQWLVKPLLHRYELMAMFYLFYLLVRSRRKK